ncbi:MAG: beta-galactosidase, partial [Blautia sp.]|nr:beta-galactosidase [Blautia sp.]
MHQIPQIKSDNGIPTLYVKGEPFFCLSGEIHNSSSSNLDYMAGHVWPALKELHLNTAIVPMYWECLEPVEGSYDFRLADGLIAQAREAGIHIVFLWFGLWKNAESMYVPGWMKADTVTYFRAEKVSGEKINTISPLCTAAVEKDAVVDTDTAAKTEETSPKPAPPIVAPVPVAIDIDKTLGNAVYSEMVAFR